MTLSYLEKKLLEKKQNELIEAIAAATSGIAKSINNAIGGYHEVDTTEKDQINAWLASAISLKWFDGGYKIVPLWAGDPPPALQRGLLKIASQELLAKIDSIAELQDQGE